MEDYCYTIGSGGIDTNKIKKMYQALNIVTYCTSFPVFIVWTILLVKIYILGEKMDVLVIICVLMILAMISITV